MPIVGVCDECAEQPGGPPDERQRLIPGPGRTYLCERHFEEAMGMVSIEDRLSALAGQLARYDCVAFATVVTDREAPGVEVGFFEESPGVPPTISRVFADAGVFVPDVSPRDDPPHAVAFVRYG